MSSDQTRVAAASRARASNARARACAHATQPPEVITLPACEIVMDEAWNSRDYAHEHGSGGATEGQADVGQQLTDEQLRESIEQRGLLETLRVRRRGDEWVLVFGFRRLRACLEIDPDMPILCTIQPATGDDEEDAFEASSANLTENLNRRDLRCFEIADKLWEMHQSRPDLSQGELARYVGLSASYTSALLRIKRRAAPELWELFCAHGRNFGNGITYKHMLEVIQVATKEDQLRAWSLLVEHATEGRPRNGTDAKNRKRASAKQLAAWLEGLDELDVSDEFREGIRFGIGLALGTESLDTEPAKAA